MNVPKKLKILFSLIGLAPLASCGPNTSVLGHGQYAPNEWQRLQFLALFSDYDHNNEIPPDENDPLNKASMVAVTREFGQSHIDMRKLPITIGQTEASIKPWSAWWYPASSNVDSKLYNRFYGQRDSALAKYDIVRQKMTGRPSNAVANESNDNAKYWEGLCLQAALAPLMMPEPKHDVDFNGVHFTIFDLKGLMFKTFEALPESAFKYYGEINLGKADAFNVLDMYPDQVHRFLEIQIQRDRKPFIFDHNPGPEIWNEAGYAFNSKIETYPGHPDWVKVRTNLFSAANLTVDEIESKPTGTSRLARTYEYVLKGHLESDGTLTVTGGFWLNESRDEHPDYIMIPDINRIMSAGIRKSKNP